MASWHSSAIVKWFRNSQVPVHLLLLSVQFSFSGFHVIGKGALEYIEPILFVFLRCLFGSTCLFLIAPFFTLPGSSSGDGELRKEDRLETEESGTEMEVKVDEESSSPDHEPGTQLINNSSGDDDNNTGTTTPSNNEYNRNLSNLSAHENDESTTSPTSPYRDTPLHHNHDAHEHIEDITTRGLLSSSSARSRLTDLSYWRHVMWPSSAVVWAELVLCGLLGVAANQSFFILGLNATSPANAAIFQPLCPIITTSLAVLLRQEHVSGLKFGGIFLAVFGAVGMVLSGFIWGPDPSDEGEPSNSSGGEGSPVFSGASAWGNLFFLGNTTVFSCYLILQKRLLNRGFPPVIATAWSFFFGAMLLGLVTIGFPGGWAALPSLPSVVWIALTYAVLVATVYGFGANTIATKITTPTVVSIYVTVQPVASTFLAWMFLGDPLRWYRIVGTVLIISGVLTVFAAKHGETKRMVAAAETEGEETYETEVAEEENDDDDNSNNGNNNNNDNNNANEI